MIRIRALLLLVVLVWGCEGGASLADGSASEGGTDGSAEATASGEEGGPSDSNLPCDVEDVLVQNCQTCHSDPPRYGAPMPLVTHDDVDAPAVSDPARAVHQLMKVRIHDLDRPMPPTGDLAPQDKRVLDDWLNAGAPANQGPACGGSADTGDDGVGEDELPCEVTHRFQAHAMDPEEGFHVPTTDDLYMCFTFRSSFAAGTQGTAWAPIIDDERVVHHWILYRTAQPQVDGGVQPCNMPADATFVSGWAPGGENFVLSEDIGFELPGPDDSLILQVHYNNVAGYADAFDKSGVAMCTTDEVREHTAGVYTLGTIDIAIPPGSDGHETSGICRSWMSSFLPEPVYAISSFPHMHELGRTIRTDILRGSDDGPADALVEVPHFSFDTQLSYPHDPPVVINPGDAIRTTCTFDNPGSQYVFFGEGTSDEMCFNFVMIYPIELFTGDRSCGLLN